jgi:hypothetical protein
MLLENSDFLVAIIRNREHRSHERGVWSSLGLKRERGARATDPVRRAPTPTRAQAIVSLPWRSSSTS